MNYENINFIVIKKFIIMKSRKIFTAFFSLFLIVGIQAAIAQDNSISKEDKKEHRKHMKDKWDSMSEEEKLAFKEKRMALHEERKAKWENMSDEEKADLKEKRQARREKMKAKWESMSEEEKSAFKRSEEHTS